MRKEEFPIYPFEFVLKLKEAAFLPENKASMLRGGFGASLKRLVCINRFERNCHQCQVSSVCPYYQIFEFLAPSPEVYSVPRPYIIRCLNSVRKFNKGDILTFQLLLFGEIARYFPYIVQSVVEFGRHAGLGATKVLFDVADIRFKGESIYQEGNLSMAYPFDMQAISAPEQVPETVTVTLVTPLKVQISGKMTDHLDGKKLGILLWRGYRDFDIYLKKGLFSDDINVNALRLENSLFYWKQSTRYSNRQKIYHSLGGLMGHFSLTINKNPDIYMLLKLSEYYGLGKNRTFGAGCLKIKEVESVR